METGTNSYNLNHIMEIYTKQTRESGKKIGTHKIKAKFGCHAIFENAEKKL